MNRVEVTVAMPAFNVVKFIAEAIDSVLAQDFNAFELIIIDDGSTDGTGNELARYAKHPRVRIAQNASNLGSGATRNLILEMARGTYFLPSDADDLLLPGALRKLSRFLNENPGIGVVYGDLLLLETDVDGLRQAPSVIGQDVNQVWDLYDNAVNHGGSMMRSDLMRQVGGYELGPVPDDWGLYLKLAEITSIHYLKGHVHYVYRHHAGTQSRRCANLQGVEQLIRTTIARRAEGIDSSKRIIPGSAR